MHAIKHHEILFIISFLAVNLSYASFTTTMSSSSTEIHDFLLNGQGSPSAKLVYSNISIKDNTIDLCYIDFSEAVDTPVVHIIESARDAKVPVLSPDGKWVVFARGGGVEAGSPVGERSSIFLCELRHDAVPILLVSDSACEPRFLQQADQLTVVYATLAPNFAWEGIGKTMTVTIDTTVDPPAVGTPKVLFEHGGYTGGLSSDGKYLCAGGGNVVMIDLTSGKIRPDTVSTFAQSCNASISSSCYFTNILMYLTTSGSHPIVNGGTPWDKWQVILINNSDGMVLKGYSYPTAYTFPIETNPESFVKAKWHHPEWSNHPYFACATLNADRYFKVGGEYMNTLYQERLYLINIKDSSYLEVLRPDTIGFSGIPDDYSGLHWPWLWVKIPEGFEEDCSWLSNITPIVSHPKSKTPPATQTAIKYDRIISTLPIYSIAVYTSNGVCLQFIKPQRETFTFALAYLNTLSKGMYFIRVKTSPYETNTFRYTVLR